MIDLSNLTGLQIGSIATMGLLSAAVVAYWQHVKSFLSFILGLLIVKVTVHGSVHTQACMRYLNTQFRMFSSGDWVFITHRIAVKRHNTYEWVGFRKPVERAIYVRFRPFDILLVSADGTHQLHLTSIRGLVNLEKIVVEAKFWSEKRQHEMGLGLRSNRFYVSERRGTANERYGDERGGGRNLKASGEDSTAPDVASNDALLAYVDPTLDHSITHAFEDYNNLEQKKRPFSDVFMDEASTAALRRAHKWRASQEWYVERSIPWRLGFLFYGPGGTGKSVMSKRIAYELNLPIFQFYLNSMTDTEFMDAWRSMETPCVALFEDFDNVFHGRVPQTEHKMLSFDCVLNMLSGVNSTDGILLIVTTNDITKLDSAMGVASTYGTISTRPGRIDLAIEFVAMNEENRTKMAHNILRDWPELITPSVHASHGMTPAQFQEYCVQLAFKRIEEEENKVVQMPERTVVHEPARAIKTL